VQVVGWQKRGHFAQDGGDDRFEQQSRESRRYLDLFAMTIGVGKSERNLTK